MGTNSEAKNKTRWVSDPAHSELMFRVKHMMISNVKGEFTRFTAEIDGENFVEAPVNVVIDTSSVYTNDESRDKHLKSADFFDADNQKEIRFEGKSVTKANDGTFELKGLLTMKGKTKEVILDVEFGGINKDPWGNEKAGFSLSGKINRKDWGLNWNAALETGGVLVSDEVRISGEIQFVKQAA